MQDPASTRTTTHQVSSPTNASQLSSSSSILSTPHSGGAESLGDSRNSDTTVEREVAKANSVVEAPASSSSSSRGSASTAALPTLQPTRTSLTRAATRSRRASSSTRRTIAFGDDDNSSSNNNKNSNDSASAGANFGDVESETSAATLGTAAAPAAATRGRNRKRGVVDIGPPRAAVRGEMSGGGVSGGKKAKGNETDSSAANSTTSASSTASSATAIEATTTLLCESSLPMCEQSIASSSSSSSLLLAPPPSSTLSPLTHLQSATSTSSASETVHNFLDPASATTSTMSSSLFGSVMASAHKAAASAGFEGPCSGEHEPSEARAATSNDRTPVKSNVSSTTGAAQAITQAPEASTMMMMMMSPGGFKILDFLHTVHNQSPMAHVTARTTNKLSQHSLSSPLAATSATPQSMASSRTPSTPSSSRLEDEDGWRDVPIDEPMVDWAVYRTVQVEVGEADPAATYGLLPSADLDVEQEARACFMADRAAAGSSRAAVQWRSSLLYWSLPRGTCRVQYQFNTGDSSSAKSGTLNTDGTTLVQSQSSSSSSNLLAKNVSRPAPVPPALSSAKTGVPPFLLSRTYIMDGKDQSSGGLVAITMDDAARRWQDALRSLYRTWVSQMVRRQQAIESSAAVDDLRIADCYFYAMGNGHSVLFRATVQYDDKENGDPSLPTSRGRIIHPQVVISSSTASVRNKLREMGVGRMRLLDRWDGHSTTEDFQESWLTIPAPSKQASSNRTKDGGKDKSSSSTSPSKPTSSPLEMSSPDVRAELTALRRAQALRQTVGASILVSTAAPKSNQGKPVAAPDRIPPLVVAGWDDCATFMEVYLNTLGIQLVENEGGMPSSGGRDKDAQQDREVDLPTLSCRRLGPFQHSCMESLSETRGTNGTVTLRGTILPCAIRELVSSTVLLLKDSQSAVSTAVSSKVSGSAPGNPQRSSRSPSSAMPSIHAIFRLQVHPGWPATATWIASSRPRVAAGRIGMCGTAFMNANHGPRHPLPPSGTSRRKNRMRCGQVLTTVVWDSEAGHLISYRVLDHRQSGAMS